MQSCYETSSSISYDVFRKTIVDLNKIGYVNISYEIMILFEYNQAASIS